MLFPKLACRFTQLQSLARPHRHSAAVHLHSNAIRPVPTTQLRLLTKPQTRINLKQETSAITPSGGFRCRQTSVTDSQLRAQASGVVSSQPPVTTLHSTDRTYSAEANLGTCPGTESLPDIPCPSLSDPSARTRGTRPVKVAGTAFSR